MNKYVKLAITAASIAFYYAVLRYAAPASTPYFMLGLVQIGYMAWLWGTSAGIITAGLLVPLTHHIYSQFDIALNYLAFAASPAYIAVELAASLALGHLHKKSLLLSNKDRLLEETNRELQDALTHVQELGGIYSICTSCKKIQDDDGVWMNIDDYLLRKTKIELSHGICPDCAENYTDQPAD